jgi:hypothetical protein
MDLKLKILSGQANVWCASKTPSLLRGHAVIDAFCVEQFANVAQCAVEQ